MVKKFKTFDPQLVFAEQIAGSAIALTNEAKLSLYKKSQKSGIPTNVLETVYYRGYKIWNESFGQTPEQFAFDRVNSFIAGGFAADLDDDLLEDAKGYKNPTGGLTQKGRDHYNRTTGSNLKAPVTTPPSKLKKGSKAANRRKSFCARMGGMEGPMRKPNGEPTRKALALRKWNCEETQIDEKTCNCWDGYKRVPGTKPCAPGSCAKSSAINEKRGLWDNIHAKRERIKNGSGERMRKPGSKGAPTAAALKASQNESFGDNYMKQGREYLKLKRAKEKAAKNPQPKMTSMETDDLVKQYLAKGGSIKKEERTTLSIIKNVIREEAASDSDKLSKFRKDLADNKAKIQIDMAEKGEKHPATQQPADFLSRKRYAEKYTPDGIEKPTKAGDGFGSVQQHLRGTLQQQVQSNQGGKFNIQRNK
jgi:hypothetical protein